MRHALGTMVIEITLMMLCAMRFPAAKSWNEPEAQHQKGSAQVWAMHPIVSQRRRAATQMSPLCDHLVEFLAVRTSLYGSVMSKRGSIHQNLRVTSTSTSTVPYTANQHCFSNADAVI